MIVFFRNETTAKRVDRSKICRIIANGREERPIGYEYFVQLQQPNEWPVTTQYFVLHTSYFEPRRPSRTG